MSESFKCQFEYNGNRYDIELSEEFSPQVLFEVIFDKIKQIIQIVSNKCLSFGSQVFELMIDFDNNYTTVLTSNDLNYVIKSNALIRVSDVLNASTSSTIAQQALRQTLLVTTNQFINANIVNIHYNPSNNTNTDNDYSKLFLSPEDNKKFSQFLRDIKNYTKNNCDLIIDYEWICVIPKRMSDINQQFANCAAESWRTNYNKFFRHYLITLENCCTYEEANNRFPLFGLYNELQFNRINSFFSRVMVSRTQFLSKTKEFYKRVLANESHSSELGAQDLVLRQSVNQLKRDEINRNTKNGSFKAFQTELESNISDIKGLNLLIQLINEEKLSSDQPNKFDIIAKKMAENDWFWDQYKCSDVLEKWIFFYEKNLANYKTALKDKNRIVEYIYEYLNVIPMSVENLKLYFESNNLVQNSITCIVANHKSSGKANTKSKQFVYSKFITNVEKTNKNRNKRKLSDKEMSETNKKSNSDTNADYEAHLFAFGPNVSNDFANSVSKKKPKTVWIVD